MHAKVEVSVWLRRPAYITATRTAKTVRLDPLLRAPFEARRDEAPPLRWIVVPTDINPLSRRVYGTNVAFPDTLAAKLSVSSSLAVRVIQNIADFQIADFHPVIVANLKQQVKQFRTIFA